MSKDIEKKLIERVEAELDEIDMDERYRDMLDECYSFDSVGGPFESMQPSRVLEEVDPIAFRCGFNDWFDGEVRGRNGLIELDNGKVYDEREVDAIREELEAEAEEDKEEDDE